MIMSFSSVDSLRGSTFTVNGAATPANSALFSAGIETKFANNVSVGAKFDSEFVSRSQTYARMGTVYTW